MEYQVQQARTPEEPEPPPAPPPPTFPDYDKLLRSARSWAMSRGRGANKGGISGVYWNESLDCEACPARVSFEKAVEIAKLDDWSDGEFGWHGTRSMAVVRSICWSNWDPGRR